MRLWRIWSVWCLFVLVASGCTLTTTPPTPTPEVFRPTVEFQYPTNGTVFIEGTDVQIQILAQDPRGVGVNRVELYVNDVFHQQGSPVVSSAVTVFTVNMNWLASGVGRNVLSAVAIRPDGTPSEPAVITIDVMAASPATP